MTGVIRPTGESPYRSFPIFGLSKPLEGLWLHTIIQLLQYWVSSVRSNFTLTLPSSTVLPKQESTGTLQLKESSFSDGQEVKITDYKTGHLPLRR